MSHDICEIKEESERNKRKHKFIHFTKNNNKSSRKRSETEKKEELVSAEDFENISIIAEDQKEVEFFSFCQDINDDYN